MSLDMKARSSVARAIQQIVEQESDKLGLEVSEDAVEALTDVIAVLTSTLGSDLESFAAHAKRKMITAEDVLLFSRRNAACKAHLIDVLETIKKPSVERKPKQFKGNASHVDSAND
eukprot:ANDGO_06484.mRNA.1 hypothetical protein CAOG_06037